MLQKLVALAPFVPLLQTLLWVLLVAILVLWLNKPLRAILAALQRRIEGGSAVKAGWLELPEFKPQPLEQQRERARQEVSEATEERLPTPLPGPSLTETQKSTSQYLLIEDLALRALQADLGVALNRQISAGPDAGFDAAFARDGKLNVVEVKYSPRPVSVLILKRALHRITDALATAGWKNARIILLLVYERPEDAALTDERVSKAVEGFELPIEVRTFLLPELKSRFGASDA
jgi:hypothetical protein